MDAALNARGIIEEFDRLLSAPDYAGAEELLAAGLGRPKLRGYRALFHFQYGRLYLEWNKLSSAVNHLEHALDLLHGKRTERQFYLVVLQALREARVRQAEQFP